MLWIIINTLLGALGLGGISGGSGGSGIRWEQWDQLGAAGCPSPFPMPMAAPPLGRAQFVRATGVDGDGPIHAAGKALPEQQLRDVPVLENGRGPGVSRTPQDPRPHPCWGGPGTAPSMSPELPVLPETPLVTPPGSALPTQTRISQIHGKEPTNPRDTPGLCLPH